MYGSDQTYGQSNLFDMRQILPDAPEEFLQQCIEEGQSPLEAATEWAGMQQVQIEKLRAKIEATEAGMRAEIEAAEAEARSLREHFSFVSRSRGQHPPLRERPGQFADSGSRSIVGGDGTARAEVNGLVSEYTSQGMSRAEAMSRVFDDDPDLRQQLIDEANENRGTSRATPKTGMALPTDGYREHLEHRMDQRIKRRRR